MSGERVKAAQAVRPPKGARMLRGTVSAVSPLTVALAGGAAVAGVAVPGAVYTVGQQVLVLWQEPGVGPVYPLTLPAVVTPPPFDVTGTFAYAGTCTDWDGGGWQTSLSRAGRVGTLTLNVRPGTAYSGGFTIGTLPSGFRPLKNMMLVASVYSPGWNGATMHVQINRDADGGVVAVDWTSAAVQAGALISGSVSYLLA